MKCNDNCYAEWLTSEEAVALCWKIFPYILLIKDPDSVKWRCEVLLFNDSTSMHIATSQLYKFGVANPFTPRKICCLIGISRRLKVSQNFKNEKFPKTKEFLLSTSPSLPTPNLISLQTRLECYLSKKSKTN